MVAFQRFVSKLSWDMLGFSASAICAIHCMAVPAFLLLSSFSGSTALHNHTLETVILLFSTIIGSISIIPSYLKHHRKVVPLATFLLGISLIAVGRLQFPVLVETVLTVGGALLVATSHWIN